MYANDRSRIAKEEFESFSRLTVYWNEMDLNGIEWN